VLKYVYVVLLAGCATPHGPSPQDTKFQESERNWLEIYRRELIICINNGDAEGFHFFMQEIQNEKARLTREAQQ
jgi:hypothetical protein